VLLGVFGAAGADWRYELALVVLPAFWRKSTIFAGYAHLSGPDSGDQARNADKGDGSSNVIGERRQTEFTSNVLQPPHQESALAHPLFDRAARMLNAVASLVEHFGSGCKARCHPIKNRLVLNTADPSIPMGAVRLQIARPASFPIAVFDKLQVARLLLISR
jgi:hypothetical protein